MAGSATIRGHIAQEVTASMTTHTSEPDTTSSTSTDPDSPFSRGLMRVSRQILVPENITDADRDRYHGELQAALDRVREFSEANIQKAGSAEFPYCDARA